MTNSLNKQLRHIHHLIIEDCYRFKYNYFSPVLDEYICYKLLDAIVSKCYLYILYYPKKGCNRYSAKSTNPKYASIEEPPLQLIAPLKVIFDHQYGRWYLLGWNKDRQCHSTFRIENIADVFSAEPINTHDFFRWHNEVVERLNKGWVLGGQKIEEVRVKFYFNSERNEGNFIRKRVDSQGRWGQITDEDENTFIYSITVSDAKEIIPWIRSFGSSAEVLSPQWLRQQFIEDWEEVIRNYETV